MLTPWDTLYHGPSSAPQRHRSHHPRDSANMAWLRHTCPFSLVKCTILLPFSHTLDFFKRQRSQALHTRLRALSECERLDDRVDCRATIMGIYVYR